MFLHLASIVTGGLYNHHDTMSPSLMAKLDQQRRDARLKLPAQALPPGSDLLASSPVVASPVVASKAGGKIDSKPSPATVRPGLGQ
jgi:hypothetical protein